MASKRFSTIGEEVLKALDRDKDSKNTKRVVKHGMNLYDEYLRSNYMDLVENPAERNNQLLSYAFFYASVRQKNDEELKKKTLDGQVGNFQASLKRV
ncbi:hypothetical protein DPMN_054651 [Dreissena polymorpha]|uniref:Uncharacterized protein n=1 Tax=Dreissena polymorpha TaxID=45954 RepID=A0A9D4CR38_DREPO|nr:hypothetical protein DPMN_054651 [Dreissena polymorpha]